MSILIIDGQGGGVGRGLVEAFAKRDRLDEVIVLGANSAATSNMIRGFNVRGATGENAVVFNCQKAEVILGPIGIIMANAMLGEITPRMAEAVSSSGPGGIVLPALTLAIAMSAKYMRQVRNAVLDEMHKDYVLAARARGERERVIFYKSVLKVALLNIVTLMALSLGSLLGGTAIVETIFMWDGVGQLAIRAITMRDYPMIQAYVVWMAIIYVCMNMAADILYKAVDPRIKEVQ